MAQLRKAEELLLLNRWRQAEQASWELLDNSRPLSCSQRDRAAVVLVQAMQQTGRCAKGRGGRPHLSLEVTRLYLRRRAVL